MKRIAELAVLVAVAFLGVYVLKDTSQEDRLVSTIEYVMPAVVEIQVEGIVEIDGELVKARVLGSGVFISEKAHVLTCAHLFNKFETITSITVESPNGDVVSGTILKVGTNVDLALLKAGYYHKTPKVKLADPRHLRVGQEVFAIGSPLGLPFTVTTGIISALHRDVANAYNATQSDTSINPGNSGGPLFNRKGELIGINSFMVPPVPLPIFTGLGFSVQCGEVRRFLTDAKKEGIVL